MRTRAITSYLLNLIVSLDNLMLWENFMQVFTYVGIFMIILKNIFLCKSEFQEFGWMKSEISIFFLIAFESWWAYGWLYQYCSWLLAMVARGHCRWIRSDIFEEGHVLAFRKYRRRSSFQTRMVRGMNNPGNALYKNAVVPGSSDKLSFSGGLWHINMDLFM